MLSPNHLQKTRHRVLREAREDKGMTGLAGSDPAKSPQGG